MARNRGVNRLRGSNRFIAESATVNSISTTIYVNNELRIVFFCHEYLDGITFIYKFALENQ